MTPTVWLIYNDWNAVQGVCTTAEDCACYLVENGGVLLKTPHMTLKQYALGNIDSDHIWSIFKKI